MSVPIVYRSRYSAIEFGGSKISVWRIARDLGINPTYLWRVVTGRRSPSLRYVQQVSAAMEMSTTQFYNAIEKNAQQLMEHAG